MSADALTASVEATQQPEPVMHGDAADTTDPALTAPANDEPSIPAGAVPAGDPAATSPPRAEIQIFEPYQVDVATPRHPRTNSASATTEAKATKANPRNTTAASTSAKKSLSRPSRASARAPVLSSNGGPRILFNGPAQRRPSLSLMASQSGSAAPVTSSGRRTSSAAAAGAGGRSSDLLRRYPRFADPQDSEENNLASTRMTARPVNGHTENPPVGRTSHTLPRTSVRLSATTPPPPPATATARSSLTVGHATSAMTADHAALYTRPIAQPPHAARATASLNNNTSVTAPPTLEANGQPSHRRRMMKGTTSVASIPAATAAPQDDVDVSASSVSAADVYHEETFHAAAETPAAAEEVQQGDTQEEGAAETDVLSAAPAAPQPSALNANARIRRHVFVTAEPAAVAAHPDKRVVVSRQSSSSAHAMRLSELTRPSESYKVTLHPSHQQSALERRSRQPRKVVNVYLTKYPVIRKLADELGFVMETTEDELNDYKFNMCWSDTVLSLMRLVRLSNWQRTNHFPSMYLLCRKGHLGTTLGKLRHKLPAHVAFYPRTWSMRSERLQFTQYMAAVRQRHVLKYFIMKPNSGCQGRGIIVTRDPLTALDDHAIDNYIVQEYVHRPLLLEGKKFDLRVYVLLTSIRHPSIFIFNDGLVRICAEAYEAPTEENVKNTCKHLTNYAVNKKSTDYVFNTDVEHMDIGNKRNFRFLNRWLEESGYSSAELWHQVGIIIVKTILAAQPSIARVYDSCFPTGYNDGYCCFEVLGFDILIDHKMRPWLMEVNHTPSFATDTPLDMDIKSTLLKEVWNIIDCKATDYEMDRLREREEFTKRNMPPWTTNHPLYGSRLNAGTPHAADAADASAASVHANASSAVNGEDGNGAEHASPQQQQQQQIPSYVTARRQHEDSKLRNFARVYPSQDPNLQRTYDVIQSLAQAESANSRLYYNTTVAAPAPPPSSSSPVSSVFSMRSGPSATLMSLTSRPRPPALGPALTIPRAFGSPTSTMPPPKSPKSPSASLTVQQQPTVLSNGAPATLSVSSVPSLAVIRSSQQQQQQHHPSTDASRSATSPAASVNGTLSATSPSAASTPAAALSASRGDLSAKQRANASAAVLPNLSHSRASAVPSDNGMVVGTTAENAEVSAGSISAAAGAGDASLAVSKSAQPVRVHTPRVSSPVTATRAAVGPSAAAPVSATTSSASKSQAKDAEPGKAATPAAAPTSPLSPPPDAAVSEKPSVPATTATVVKPRPTEVHRRVVVGRRPTAPQNAVTDLHTSTKEKSTFESSLKRSKSTGANTPVAGTTSLNGSYRQPHQSLEEAPPAVPPSDHAAHAHKAAPHASNGVTAHAANLSGSRQKSPSAEPPHHTIRSAGSGDYHQHQPQPITKDLSASLRRKSRSLSANARDGANGAHIAHVRQKSGEREPHSMSTHPEPTEEELARLVALQAQLDYEAAADPVPDDEDENYTFTE